MANVNERNRCTYHKSRYISSLPKLESTSTTARSLDTEVVSPRTMADPPATHHIANSIWAVTATLTDDMAECTNAQAGGTVGTKVTMPTPSTKPSVAASMVNPTERAVATSPTMPNHVDIATLEPKAWPRLHLLGLPRELRDQIYTYAIVSDKPVNIGTGGRRQRYFFQHPSTHQSFPPTST